MAKEKWTTRVGLEPDVAKAMGIMASLEGKCLYEVVNSLLRDAIPEKVKSFLDGNTVPEEPHVPEIQEAVEEFYESVDTPTKDDEEELLKQIDNEVPLERDTAAMRLIELYRANGISIREMAKKLRRGRDTISQYLREKQ